MTPYVRSLTPHNDFALVVGEGLAGPMPRFKTEAVQGCALLQPAGAALPLPSVGPLHFSGIGFREGQLVTRETADDFAWGPEAHDGNYTVIVAEDDGLMIANDAFGIGVLFVYRAANGRKTIISNNLHMLLTICRLAGLPLHAHEESFFKRLHPFSLGQQPSGSTAFFDEISMVGVGDFLRIRQGAVHVETKPRVRHAAYGDALAAGVEALRNQVRAGAAFGDTLVYRMSGGYDSRAIFGALLKEKLLPQSWCWTFPEKEDDFRVVKLLVNYYGGKFADNLPWRHDTRRLDIEGAFNMRLSHNCGLYSSHLGFELHPRRAFDCNTVIVFNGGGGECFRDFYFTTPDIEQPGVLESQITRLIAHRFPSLGASSQMVADLFARDFRSMPGETLKEKMRSHYLNFRNRFHFGNPTASRGSRINLTPLMQTSFLDAAEALRRSNRDFRHMLHDLFMMLDDRLALFPFDEEAKAFGPEFLLPGAEKKRKALLEELRDLNCAYDPVSLSSNYPEPEVTPRENRIFLERKMQQAAERVRDHGIYRSVNFDGYLADLFSVRARNQRAYKQYRDSLISTAHLLDYAA